MNLEVIRASGAKTVIFGCPEGYTTFKIIIPSISASFPSRCCM